jgi:hypothetical protein
MRLCLCTHARLRMAGFLATSMACAIAAFAEAAIPESGPAASLRERYAALSEQLEQSPLQPGLYLESIEQSRASQGDIYALVDYPFATVSNAFTSPANWCEALILHLNVKYCHTALRGEQTVLLVAIGKKIDQPLTDTYRVELVYNVTTSGEDYMQVDLDATKGPLGTRNYHIALELLGLDGERAFLHVRYSYTYGPMARLAMRIYLATSGHNKVGFTMIGGENSNPPRLVGGVRGALERNTLRYYLAIESYLGALATPAPQRFEDSLERWFTATERYALQLHEVDHDAYIAMKRREYLRQQAAAGADVLDNTDPAAVIRGPR